MGTRADFYVGRGEKAEWLGSVAFDGYPDGFDRGLFGALDEAAWRALVSGMLAGRDDGTRPEDGWPWPWQDSRTTDYAYAFDEGRVWVSCYGGAWFDPDEDGPKIDDDAEKVAFPNMLGGQAVTLGPRSGVILVSVGKDK